MKIKLQYLPEQIQADLAEAWSRAGLNKAQIDTQIAELESLDWKNAKTVTYAHARSVGAKVNFNLFRNVVNPGRFAGSKSGEEGAGTGANVRLEESTQGLLVYDRKTKELQFIPTEGYFKDAEKEYKEDKKEDRKERRKAKRSNNDGPYVPDSEWTNMD